MKILFIIIYLMVLFLFGLFVHKRLGDINDRNIENVGCSYLRKRNNIIFLIITILLLILFLSGSLVIFTLL